MADQETKAKVSTAGDRLFWGSVGLSVIWCIGLVTLAYYRAVDYQPLLTPLPASGDKKPLTLNEIGDTLAGAFAPLAFLWFFVSTWLQRTELKETRQVLADQQAELQRSAQESTRQTAIMQRQLETARTQEIYEEHRLRMYYLAKLIHDRLLDDHLGCALGHDTVHFSFYTAPATRFALSQNNETVDAVFKSMRESLDKNFEASFQSITLDSVVLRRSLARFNQILDYISKEVLLLLDEDIYRSNRLIAARLNGIDFLSLSQLVLATRDKLAELQSAEMPSSV